MYDWFAGHLGQIGIGPRARVVVGYSGGPDSTCLLHLCTRAGLDVVAAHLHHGQRLEADGEAEQCATFASQLSVPFVLGNADVPAVARTQRIGLDEAGRRARYSFLETTKLQTAAQWILTAHTMDDHVETVLMRIARGTGLTGLRGVPMQRGAVLRPLLSVTREQTRTYCLDNNLWFHDDPCNVDMSFPRARVRQLVLPELVQLNPKVRDSISRLSQLAEDEDEFLDSMAAAHLEASEHPHSTWTFLTLDREVILDRTRFLHGPRVLIVRGLRLLAKGLDATMDFHAVQALWSGFRNDRGSLTLLGGEVVVEWTPGVIHVRQLGSLAIQRQPLDVPGRLGGGSWPWILEVTEAQSPTTSSPPKGSIESLIDRDKVVGGLWIQSYQATDRLVAAGQSKSKTVPQLLKGQKLTQAGKAGLPIVYDFVGPVWVPNVCIADRVKWTDNSIVGLCLSLRPHR